MADFFGDGAGPGEPLMTPLQEPLSCSSSCYEGCGEGTAAQGNTICMPPHVFAFCILLSAVASGVVVASQRIWDKLREALAPVGASAVHNPRHGRSSASRGSDRDSEATLTIEAAKAMDRAVAVPREREDKVPARYVRAFCGNERHALARWKATLQWRKDNDIDAILNEPQPHFHDIRRYFPSHMSGRSRGGHIVVYEKIGRVDMETLSRQMGITVPILLRHWIFVSEYMYRVLQPTDSAQQVTVEDMKGIRMQSLAGKVQEYAKGAAQLARLYYVERCHKTFVVNAPAWFGLAFRLVSPFLSARTRQKIRILGSDLSPLQDEIDPQFLPVEYGGKRTVPVSESPEERKLHRLVDAINAKSEAAAYHDGDRCRENGATASSRSHGSSSTPVTPLGRTSLPKTSPMSDGKAAARSATRSRSGKGSVTPLATKERKGQASPSSTRPTARPDEPPGGANDAKAHLTIRRGTWAGERVTPGSRMETRSASQGDISEKPWGARKEAGVVAGFARGEGPSPATPVSAPRSRKKGDADRGNGHGDGDGSAGEPWVYGGEKGSEQGLPIEERPQAATKDLVFALNDSVKPEGSDLVVVRRVRRADAQSGGAGQPLVESSGPSAASSGKRGGYGEGRERRRTVGPSMGLDGDSACNGRRPSIAVDRAFKEGAR